MGSIANQITPQSPSTFPSNQQNFGQLIGEVASWNPSADIAVVQNFINNAVRDVYDHRLWYGLMRKGQIVTPGFYSTGSVTMTLGSPTVTGTGTAWTTALIGRQFRQGFTSPIYNIINVDPIGQALTLELPWGLPTQTTVGYFITQFYYSFPNIKYFYSVKNLQLMYRIWTNVPQSLLENWDPSRLQMVYPRVLATMPPDAMGNYQCELWPAPNVQMALPYLAYVQPPNLVDDSDNLPPFMRADMIKAKAISEVMMYRPKSNSFYSESMCLQISQEKNKEYLEKLFQASQADENLYRQDIVTQAEAFPLLNLDWSTGQWLGGGATLAAMTATSAYGEDY